MVYFVLVYACPPNFQNVIGEDRGVTGIGKDSVPQKSIPVDMIVVGTSDGLFHIRHALIVRVDRHMAPMKAIAFF